MITVAWLLGAALSASAHEIYPIKPVRATLKLEPDRIVADLQADSIYWIEEVTQLRPMPVANWPAKTRADVEAYVNAHFKLEAGGRALTGSLSQARYRQFPWEVNEEGTIYLRLVYPAAASGSTLTGTAEFYKEYRQETLLELRGRPLPYADGYRTFVKIPGRKEMSFTLTPESPSFAAPVDEARRSTFSMALESFARGAETALSVAACFPLLLAAALCLGAKPVGRSLAAALLASAIGGSILGRTVNVPPWTPWAATLGVSLAACRLERGALLYFAAAAVGCLACVWHAEAWSLLAHAPPAVPAAFIGSMSAGALLLAAALRGLRAEHARLRTVSQSRVEELLARRLRLSATALSMVGAYGLWQSLPR